MNQLDELVNKLQIFEKTYQIMRIVDPFGKTVLVTKGDEYISEQLSCHGFFGKGTCCDNCISIRAYNENDTFFKIENKNGHIFLVTAVPVIIDSRRAVVELIKDATNSIYIGDDRPDAGANIYSLLEYINREAVKDVLTEVFNRRYINERLPVDLFRASATQKPISVIFADVDHFKKVNDTYGHRSGDLILSELARELERQIRKGPEWVARYGGEEFMICMPDTTAEAAAQVAERIRSSIEEKAFEANGQVIRVTCSFGVITIPSGAESVTLDEVLNMADRQLYKAKNAGRNKVACASSEDEKPVAGGSQ